MHYDLNAALSAWLAATLTAYSLGIWSMVVPLAGGPDAPLWRWVLVEEGLFVLWLFLSAWWVRLLLGPGRARRTPQHWGSAAVFACILSLLCIWYSLTATQAIALGVHPRQGWEWVFFTWGLPMLLAGSIIPGSPFLAQFGLALGIGAGTVLLLGRVWAQPYLCSSDPPFLLPWPRPRV